MTNGEVTFLGSFPCLRALACYNARMHHSLTFLPFGWVPALASFFAMLLLYHLWLSPVLFERSWVRHSGIRPTDIRKGDKRRVLIASLLARAFSTLLLGQVAAHTLGNQATLFITVACIWLFIAFEQLIGVFARREPFSLFLLLTLRSLLTLMLGALVYYLWSFL